MTQYLIMCRSLTHAQKALRLLERAGITATLIKAPQILTTGGCGYALSVYKRYGEAINILIKNNMLSGKVFSKTAEGDYQEVRP